MAANVGKVRGRAQEQRQTVAPLQQQPGRQQQEEESQQEGEEESPAPGTHGVEPGVLAEDAEASQAPAGAEVEEVTQREPRVPKSPFVVSNEEREKHEITHTPFRTWCRYCVMGRARNTPHLSRGEAAKRSGVPKIALDYFFMSGADEAASQNPLCVMVDEESGERYARAVGQKGLGSHGELDWLIKDLSDELVAWGHLGGPAGHIILKSDGEPSIVAVREALARYHGGRVVPEDVPRGESQSNGTVEEAGKTVREYARVLKAQLEEKTGMTLHPGDSITAWMVRWAAMLYSRYAVGKDGLTPYERRRGRKCRVPAVCFGEKVWFKLLRVEKNRKDKFESDMREGVWLGHTRSSNGHVVGTKFGICKAYIIKRQDSKSRWCSEAIRSLRGTPHQRTRTDQDLLFP